MGKNLDKYQKWLNEISEEVKGLTFSFDVWSNVTDIENNSPHFKKYGGHFQHWQNQNYTYRMIMTIGKITDPNTKQKDDLNFIKFLSELKNSNYISFDKFLATFNPKPIKEEERKVIDYYKDIPLLELSTTIEGVQKDFEDIIGCLYTETDFSKMIDKDIETIKQIFNQIKKLRHKKLAHFTKANLKQIPTYQDIEQSIITLQNIVKKYYLLLFNIHQTFHYYDLNVKTVFEKTWIKND